MWFFISLVVTPTSKGQQLCMWIENINKLWYQFFNFDLWNFISHKLIAVQQKKFLWRLHQHVKANGAAIQAHSMCSSALLCFPDYISFCDILRHGSQIDGSGPELHQGEQGQDSTHATRCVKGDGLVATTMFQAIGRRTLKACGDTVRFATSIMKLSYVPDKGLRAPQPKP